MGNLLDRARIRPAPAAGDSRELDAFDGVGKIGIVAYCRAAPPLRYSDELPRARKNVGIACTRGSVLSL
jgi:hypothetical protein